MNENKITSQEAIEILQEEHNWAQLPSYVNTSLDVAIAALKRQIPQKPIFYDTKFRQRGEKYGELVTLEKAYNCPVCRNTLWKRDKQAHCEDCGQALDWSDSE